MRILLALLACSLLRAQGIPTGSSVSVHSGGGGVTVTQVGIGDSNGVSVSFPVTLTTTPTPGHTLAVSLATFNCTAVTITITDNQSGNTYTKATTDAQNTVNLCTQLFTAPNIHASGTFTLTIGSTIGDYIKVQVLDIGTSFTSSVVDSVGTATNTNTSSGSGTVSISTTNATTVVIGNFSGNSTGITTTPGSGWTLAYSDQSLGTTPISLDTVYNIFTTSGSYSPNVGWSVPETSGYVAQAVAIKY